MTGSKLPPQLVSLVHHVELNKAGWFDNAVRRFITATLWLIGTNPTVLEIRDHLASLLGVRLDEKEVTRHVDALARSGAVLHLPSGHVKLTEQTQKTLGRELQEAEQVEKQVRERFNATLASCCPTLSPDETWQRFTELFLLPFVREMGARTYELLSSATLALEKTISFGEFLQRYPQAVRPNLQEAIVTFLDPKDSSVRTYVFRHLNAYFLIEASSLSGETLRNLASLASLKPNFNLFLDTNFLFSILALHDSPGNEAALALVELVKTLPQNVTVKLYVSPLTLDETRGTIIANRESLRNLRLTPNVADAIRRGQLSGIAMKFAQECVRLNRSLSADDYFTPYANNLLDILRAKGVEFYNESMDAVKGSQDVIDDLNDQLEFEKKHFGDRAKTYEQLIHDLSLWHFARRKRPARVESPIDALYWVATIDFRFLGFDAFKRRRRLTDVPVSIHPAVLVQMLQFWLPRTTQFEEAIVASIKYPIFFYEYDAEAEKTTIRILEVLGRFEGVGDLPKDAITRVLVSEALRQKLAVEHDADTRIALIRDALIAETGAMREQFTRAREEIDELGRDLAAKDKTILHLQSQLEGRAGRDLAADDALARERERAAALEGRISELERESRERVEGEVTRRIRRKFALLWLGLAWPLAASLVVGATFVFAYLGRNGLITRWTFWSATVASWTAVLLVWAWQIARTGAANPPVANWPLFSRFLRFKTWLFTTLWALLLAAAGNAFHEWFKQRS